MQINVNFCETLTLRAGSINFDVSFKERDKIGNLRCA